MDLAEFAARRDAEQPEVTTAIVPAAGSMASSFGKWLEETEGRQAKQAATLAEGFKDRGFDEMAAAHEMARATSEQGGPALPPAMFLGDQLRSTIEMRQAQRAFEEAPSGLIRWSLEDPTNAVLAKGDMENLSMVGALAHDATFAAKSMAKGFPASLRFNAAAQRAAAAAQAPEDREKTFFDILREEAAQIGEPSAAPPLDVRVIKKLTGLEIDTGAGMDLLSMLPDAAGRYLRSRIEPEGGDEALVAERTAYAKQRLDVLQGVMTELADERGRSTSYTRFTPVVDKISNDKALTPMQQVVEMTRAISNDPAGGFAYLLSTTAESVPGLTVAALAARVGVNPVAVMGATSYARAETQSFAQVAKDRGFDVNNPEDVFNMFQSPEFVASLTDASQRYSATVALWDAMSGAAAGQALAKSPMGDILLQSIAQGSFGGLGEMAGQLASGQDVNGVEIMLEVLAEFTTAPLEVAAVGGRGFGRASGATQALEDMRDRRTQKRQNENERRFFDALATASDKSELKAKAPKAYRDAVASMMDGTPTDTVYADAQAVEELLQSGKVNPVEFQQATGLTPEQVAETAAQGGDVQISTADYAARVAGTPVAQALRDHVRLSPETLSAAELASAEEVDTQQLAAQLADEVTAGTATFAPEIEAARARMAEEYARAGRPTAEVDQVTTMYAAFAQTTADTLGVDHRAFLRRFPLPTVRAGADAVSPALNQTAYHGTPHVFDRFDISRIGTGEGNAAYGWGLYFAQEEAVARNYQQALAPAPKMSVRGEAVPDVRIMSDWGSFVNTMRRGGTLAEAREAQAATLDKRAAAMEKFPDVAAGYARKAADIRAMPDSDFAFEGAGNFYVVDVPEDEDLMDWDAPLAAQSELTQARARAAAEKVGVAYDAKMTGQALYRALAAALGGREQDSYKLASEALRDAGFAGHRYLDAGSRGTIGGPGTRNFVVYSDEAVELLTRNGQTLYQSNALRAGTETLERYGLNPKKKKYTTRQVAAALEARQREKHGVIARNDKSPAALKKLSKWLAEEVMFEVEQAARNPRASAVGWYTTKTQAAIDAVGEVFPELLGRVDTSLPGVALLGDRQAARDFFTAIIAITSDGAKVQENFRSAVRIYGAFRESGTVAASEGVGNIRNSYAGNLAILQDIVTQKGPAALRDLLLTELTVSELKKLAKENGIDIGAASKMQADMTVPYAAVAFGPKLGAFYANLMGHTGYLTMDRWWSRTFNRLRGQLLEVPTEAGIARVRQLLIDAGADPADVASDEQVLAATVAPRDAYAAKKFKNGTELEKAANTLHRAAFENLQDVPWGAKDRAFMVEVAKAAQAALKKRGVAMTIADIQAVLWYYEKRLYGKLGARQSKDISYEEAAAAAAAEYSAGRSSDADAGRPEEPSGDDGLSLDLGDEQILYIDDNARILAGLDEEQVEAPRWDFVPFGDELFQSAPPAFRLPDLEKASPGPVPGVREVATSYMQRHGLPIRHQASYVTVDVERAREIARLYDEAVDAPNDPAVRAAYEALSRETVEQYKALLELGFTFEWITGEDPYASPREAILDMQQNRHLWVFPTTEGFGTVNEAASDHPLLQPTEFEIDGRIALVNDLFRIVHDVFGHGSEGAAFGARGEENAWQAHVRMFSPLAARAMTAETRGQNSWVNFGPYGEQNRANPANTVFADQKATLLPAWVSEVGQAQDRPVGEVMGWPTIDDFRFGFSPDLLQRDGWFIVTGMREAFGDQSDPRQAEANARLRATMDEMGLDYIPISGMYKGEPQGESYLVAGDPAVGRNLGRAFGQESILTFRGLEYSDGRPDTPQLPAETVVGPGALQSDFYSVMPDGTPWTMGLDWGEPAEGVELFQSAPPVESDAFKAWFGDSKVVDENGAPLVVYHGTNADFEAFDPARVGSAYGVDEAGFFFTSREDEAAKWAERAPNATSPRVLEVYLSVKKPWVIDAPEGQSPVAYFESGEGVFNAGPQNAVAYGISSGYDGMIVRGENETMYIVFAPEQIKSVDNRGTFDPADPRILYQSAPPRMYYSPLLEGVRTAKQAKAKGKDWLAILPKLPGVKEAELVFTGVLDWLGGLRDDTVTREEVVAHIERPRVQIEGNPFPLFQEKRGSIVLPTAEGQRPALTIFAGSDASTVIHEGAHWFLHVTETLVQSGDAPQRMVDQWKALTDWWRSRAEEIAREAGTDVAHVMVYLDGEAIDSATGRAIWTAIHENTARGFELYASEGKAPTLGLRAAFESFRAWMIAVYRMATLDRALAVQITDEVRLVFDQWLATDEQIAQARATGQVDPAAAAKAGVQQGDLDVLAKLALEAQEEAQAYMLGLPGPRMAKRHEWRVARAKALEAARAELAAQPNHQAVAWLTKFRWIGEGETPDYLPAVKIDRQGIVDAYGEEIAAEIADMTQVDGIDHDDMAPLFGFDSGDALVQAIRSTPDFTRAVRARATAALRAQQARPTADDIDAATHGDKRGQLLAAELRALRKAATGIPVFTRRQAALIAEQTIRAMPARAAVKSENFLAAERRAGRRVEEAMAKGDMRAAAIAKRDQLIQHSLYNQSRKAAELVEKARRRAKRLQSAGTRKSLAGEYLPAIDQVLEQYDFRKLARGAELDRTRLAAYVKMMTDAGRASELAIPRHVLDEAKRRPYLTLSVAELEGVLDTLVNIEHTARLKNKLRNAQRERDLRATVDAVVAEMDTNLPDKPRARVRTQAERMGDALRNYANIALNVETRLRQYGGWRLGAAYDAIKADIDAAGVYEQTLAERRDIELEKLYGLYSRRERIGMARRRRHEALGGEFSQWELISAALNMGNAENMSRLKGRDTNKPFSDAQIEYIQSQLTDKDWDFVEGTWELVDSYWPLIAERERRVTGTVPKKVEAEPFTLPSGRTLRGGYYPIRYDGTLSSAVSEEELQERLQAMQGGRFGKAQTKQGHLEARTGSGGRVLLLDMGVLHQHLTDIIHDLAFAEVTADTWRVLRAPELRDAFQRKGLQPDLEMLEIWVQDVAMGASVGGGWAGRTAMAIKGNFTTSRLAANLSTITLQLTGYTHSVAVVGAGNMAAGLAQFAANPRGAWMSVLSQSEFMRHKTRLIQPDVAEMRMQSTQSAAIGAKGAMQRVIDLGMAPIQLFQIAVDIPTWIAAQRKALREGMAPEQARRFADRAVVRAQGGTAVADRTAFERGSLSRDTRWNGALRLFATLASFMMTKGNLMREIAGKAATERTVEAAFTGAFHMALIVMIEAMISEAVRGQLFEDDDDEDPAVALAKKAVAESAKTALGTLPFVRDVASYADGFGGGGGYGAAVETIGKPVKELQQGELDKALLKAVNNAVGLATGLPSGQINRIIDAAANSGEDDASFTDYLFGVKK